MRMNASQVVSSSERSKIGTSLERCVLVWQVLCEHYWFFVERMAAMIVLQRVRIY